jgi:hypothetical protein
MNKELPKDTLEKLQVTIARLDASLSKIALYSETHHDESYDDLIEFLKDHQGHAVWLINDYFDEGDNETHPNTKAATDKGNSL